ncbi:hypothetical protein KC248_07075 [Klebsiella michiganensis]|uniref:hypothetical protein n=1 Tax=Klebsiella michiganensis TaxID=1134687 RepID=UPI0015E9E6F8|nr:hypothetical protein [Klebsiella michiganensis]MBR7530628.1 hypothetical protein [Klebsiella michiganensis]MBR7570504.1 hypothetical protein [Klebsiella michiganensis]QLU23683.1 hypothetical protein HV192_07150 [Klebsiella oxytoca]
MSDNTRLNVWERNNIPVLEFCSLKRAADLLDCQVNDLIHFAQIGIIEFCLELNGFEAALMMMRKGGDFEDWENTYPPSALNYNNASTLSYFIPKATSDTNYEEGKPPSPPKQIYHLENKPDIKSPLLLLSGLWSICVISPTSSLYKELKVYGEAKLLAHDISFKEANMPFTNAAFGSNQWVILAIPPFEGLPPIERLVSPSNENIIGNINLDDIYLTRYQIEKLDNGVGRELPSYVNGGVSSIESIRRVHGNVEVSATKREAVYKAAIYWLLNDPESCNGKRGKLTIDAWADKIVAERNNPKTKVELGKDKIKECLSSSKAGKF